MKSIRRCKNRNTTLLSLFMFLLFLYEQHSIPTLAEANRNVYIVYMGKGQQRDPKLLLETHLEILTGVLGSKEASAEAMVYSYKHGFTGFAAKLTGTQAQIISVCAGEPVDHLLLHCDVTRVLWDEIFRRIGVAWVMPMRVVDLMGC